MPLRLIEKAFEQGAADITCHLPGLTPSAAQILIVDDDPVVRSLMRDSLEDVGFAVVEAEDGVEACRALRRRTVPSLLIVDAVMPNMDGFELCRRLRAACGDPVRADPDGDRARRSRLDRQGLRDRGHRLHRQAAQLADPQPPHPLHAARCPHPRGPAPEPAASSRRAGTGARAEASDSRRRSATCRKACACSVLTAG